MAGSIHIKLDYPEALSLKRDSLILEKNLLEAIKYMRNYSRLRAGEFVMKAKVKKDMAAIVSIISSLEASLPRHEAEEMIKKGPGETLSKERMTKEFRSRISEKKKSDIEREIDEIRGKLASLGGEGL